MKWIEPNVIEETPEYYDKVSLMKVIEMAGRTSYKSFDRLTEDSYERFYNMIKDKEHLAVTEFATCNFKYTFKQMADDPLLRKLSYSCRRVERLVSEAYIYATTDLRDLLENGLEELFDDKYLVEPEERYHRKRRTFRIITSIGTAREILRSRTFSYCMESTRYINYSKDRFGGEIKYCTPYWFKDADKNLINKYTLPLIVAEQNYIELVTIKGLKPEQARGVLPLDTATEFVMCGYESDWDYFLKLRSPKAGAKGVHEDCAKIADMIYNLIKQEK